MLVFLRGVASRIRRFPMVPQSRVFSSDVETIRTIEAKPSIIYDDTKITTNWSYSCDVWNDCTLG